MTIKHLLFFTLPVIVFTSFAQAIEIDRAFLLPKIQASDCKLEPVGFAQRFGDAIDRLSVINLKVAYIIRTQAYRRNFTVKCDPSPDAAAIYFDPSDQAIHLRNNAADNSLTSASFFHEFLHFAGVKIDIEYHNAPDKNDFLERDSVYACHFSVFPEIFAVAGISPSRIQPARERCAAAEIE